MRILYTPCFYNHCKNLMEPQHSSSLLIPAKLKSFWDEKTSKEEESRRDYLHLLLKKYRFLIYNGILGKSENLMTEFQEKDQALQKIAICPYPEDWAELKQLKAFFNKSICLIVVLLVLLDSIGVIETLPEYLVNFVVPKKSHFRLYAKAVFSRKNFFYDRVMQFRRDKYHKKV